MLLLGVLLLPLFLTSVSGIYCYRCVSSEPGCGLYDFDIRYHWSYPCPANDKCLKIIESNGADVFVTRDCLSNLGHRRDVPADHYEGCRPAPADPLLAHYVTPSIRELDIRRTHYKNKTFCFCDFDERCNSSIWLRSSLAFLMLSLTLLLVM